MRFLKKKKCDSENAIFMKNGLLKCDFCKNAILKIVILKM